MIRRLIWKTVQTAITMLAEILLKTLQAKTMPITAPKIPVIEWR